MRNIMELPVPEGIQKQIIGSGEYYEDCILYLKLFKLSVVYNDDEFNEIT